MSSFGRALGSRDIEPDSLTEGFQAFNTNPWGLNIPQPMSPTPQDRSLKAPKTAKREKGPTGST